jgi:hypothetical protein
MQNLNEITLMLGALELGIIPPGRCIDQVLNQLSIEQRQITKRKFRKVIRKNQLEKKALSTGEKRMIAESACRKKGREILNG